MKGSILVHFVLMAILMIVSISILIWICSMVLFLIGRIFVLVFAVVALYAVFRIWVTVLAGKYGSKKEDNI